MKMPARAAPALTPSFANDPSYVIAGSGLTGATIARMLADAGRDVLVLERRAHAGGNLHDHLHPSGIRIHTYGPHYFRTSSDTIWQFVNRFARFYPYTAALKTLVDGAYENWPVSASYIRRTLGDAWHPAFTGTPRNFEEAALAMMPESVYAKFVKGYTQKQWGVDPRQLSAALARRFEVRHDNEPRLARHKHQGLPVDGYTAFIGNLLAGLPVVMNCDYLQHRDAVRARTLLIFTGPIDEYFEFCFGRLKYRTQRRTHRHLPQAGFALPCGQVNNPDPSQGAHIRTLEWKHMMPPEATRHIQGTVLTIETPETALDPEHYEYPFPDPDNDALYRRYRALADSIPGLLICGRLGEYTYYDMDQAIGRAMKLARAILAGHLPARHADSETRRASAAAPASS